MQVKRLLIVFAVFVSIFLVLRHFLTPASFGQYGHYRGDALEEIAAIPAKYVDRHTCAKCHEEKATLLQEGEHAPINCQICHGPGYKHEQYYESHTELQNMDSLQKISNVTPEEFRLQTSNVRDFCLRCHLKNASRPVKTINQVDIADHYNVDKKCVECHNPHAPWK